MSEPGSEQGKLPHDLNAYVIRFAGQNGLLIGDNLKGESGDCIGVGRYGRLRVYVLGEPVRRDIEAKRYLPRLSVNQRTANRELIAKPNIVEKTARLVLTCSPRCLTGD